MREILKRFWNFWAKFLIFDIFWTIFNFIFFFYHKNFRTKIKLIFRFELLNFFFLTFILFSCFNFSLTKLFRDPQKKIFKTQKIYSNFNSTSLHAEIDLNAFIHILMNYPIVPSSSFLLKTTNLSRHAPISSY